MIGSKIGSQWVKVDASEVHAARSYTCGYCDHLTGGVPAWGIGSGGLAGRYLIRLCSFCQQPTYFDGNLQVPAPRPGTPITGLPDKVGDLYEQARSAFAVAAYACVVMACRKLLMNIAAEKGAPDDLTFQKYVDWLAANGWVPPNGKAWADRIRQLGNDATHSIDPVSVNTAKMALDFTARLLKFAHEYDQPPPGMP